MEPYIIGDCIRENVRIVLDPDFPRQDEEGLDRKFGKALLNR